MVLAYHSKALRKGRWSEAERPYLVTTVTDRRRQLFADFAAARILIRVLRDYDVSAATLAYVLMPDHLHWLLTLHDGSELSPTVQAVKSITARRLRSALGVEHRIWQPGFHDHAVRAEEDLRVLARYVIANPIRAGLVRSVREYRHCDACWL